MHTMVSPKLLNRNQDHFSKKVVFLINPYKIKVVTSLIEMLVIKLLSHDDIYNIIESRYKILLMTSWTKIMTS